MADQFVAEIRIFPFNFAPIGWAVCSGQIMPIAQNTALFSLVGTMYGGNGTSNFALPDLQGRAPLSFGQGAGLTLRDQGETGGAESVALLQTEIPSHAHQANASSNQGDQISPENAVWALTNTGRQPEQIYGSAAPSLAMNANALAAAGSSQPHNNMPPYLTFNFCIALQGIFPPRS